MDIMVRHIFQRAANYVSSLEMPRPSFEALCFNTTPKGNEYAEAIKQHSLDLFQSLAPSLQTSSLLLVDIPRGGLATGDGIASGMQTHFRGATFRHIQSGIKTDSQSLFGNTMFDDIDTLIVADGVVGTGGTIVRHLHQIPQTWHGHVIVFTNACSELGEQSILRAAMAITQPTTLVTGRIFAERECQWQVFGDDKQVYFVGFNKENGIDYALPDFGDHISVDDHQPGIALQFYP